MQQVDLIIKKPNGEKVNYSFMHFKSNGLLISYVLDDTVSVVHKIVENDPAEHEKQLRDFFSTIGEINQGDFIQLEDFSTDMLNRIRQSNEEG